jgi:hypothetical protein
MSIAAIRESVIRAGLDATAYEAGAKRVQAANTAMAASGDRVATTQERTTRTTTTSAGAVERLQRELDRTYQAQRRFEQAQDRIGQATQRGLVSQARGAELLDLARQRYLGAGQAAQTAAGGIDRFGVAGNAAVGVAEGMNSRLGTLGAGLSALGPAGAIAGAGLGLVVTVLTAGVRAAEEFERLSLRTAAVVRATGGAAGFSAEEIRGLSQEIARNTLASTAGVEAAAAKLLTFRSVAGETFERTLRAAQDLAAVGFGTIESASVQLGKALENPIQGVSQLAEVGVSFSAAQREVIRSLVETGQAAEAQRVILAAVELQVGGAGRAEAGGLAGAYDTLGQNIEEFLVRIGNTGPIQAATGALNLLAAAIRGVDNATGGRSERETLQQSIAAAQLRVAQARAAIPNPDNIDSSFRSQFDRAAMRGVVAQREAALRAAESSLRTLNDQLAEMDKEAQQQRFGQFVQGERARLAAEKEAAEGRLTTLRTALDRDQAARDAHAKRVREIDRFRNLGLIDAAEATRLGVLAQQDLDKALTKTAEAHRAVAREAADADAHVKAYLADQAKAAAETEAAQRRVAQEMERWSERSFDAVANIGERAFDRLGDTLVDVFVRGQGASVNFANVLRGVIASAAADLGKLAFVNPLLNSVFTSSSGPRPTLAAAFGGGGLGGLGQLLGISGLLPSGGLGGMPGLFGIGASGAAGGGGMLSGLGDMLGLSNLLPGGGLGGLFSGALGATAITGWGTSTSAALGAMGGAYGPASLAQLNAFGGGGLMGGAGATFGQLLGGAGAGFGAGMLLNGLLGGNQTGGMIGSGLGSGLGALLGSLTPLGPLGGALIGGLLGGGGGGLFGPGESVKGWSYAIKAANPNPAYGDAFGDQIRMDDVFFNESGRAQFDQANAAIAQINEFLAARGLTVRGARAVGGNKDGPDASWGGAASFNDAFATFQFGTKDNATLAASLAGRSFADPGKLQEWVDGFLAAQQAIEALTAEPVAAFQAQLDALNASFDAAIETARKYGLAEDGLTVARDRALAALEAQRAETLRQTSTDLALRRMVAGGGGMEADLAQQAENARREVAAFTVALDALGLSAAENAALLVDLEETQAAERAAIIRRYGEEAAAALRQAGGTIRQYLDRLASGTAAGASPTDRLAAAQAQFDRDRTLSMGGDRDALGRVTGSADALLSAGRDMFASAPEFQAILASVRGGLEGLPVLQSYDAMQAASLTAIQAAIEAGTLNTAIVPGGNTVQIANLGELTGIASGLALLHATAADQLQTAVNQVGTLISLGAYLAAANAYAEAGNWRLHHLAQLGEAINGNATLANRIAAEASAASVAGFGALTTVTVDSNAAITTSLALANTLLAANDNRLRDLNTSLHTIDRSARDVNASLATVDARIANGLAAVVLAQNAGNIIAVDASAVDTQGRAITNTHLAALLAATQAGTAHGLVTAGQIQVVANRAHSAVLHIATHQQYTLQGNAIASAQLARLLDLNASLGAIDRSARDINASLATVDARVAAVQAAQTAGNVIAVDAANATVAALNAANLITATGAEVTVSALNAGNTIQATYFAQSMGYQAALVAQVQTMTQQLADLRQAVQQAGVVVAQETRAGAQFVGVRVEQVDDTLRRNAA